MKIARITNETDLTAQKKNLCNYNYTAEALSLQLFRIAASMIGLCPETPPKYPKGPPKMVQKGS